MNKLRILSILFIIALGTNCSEEIELVGSGEQLPVVYAIFDASDTVHSVRLGKSFSGEMSVSDLLKNPENYSYSKPEIYLVQLSSNKAFSFKPNRNISKEEGDFPTSPNPIFQLSQKLLPGDYELVIIPEPGGDTIRSGVSLFNDLRVAYPTKTTKRIYFYDDPVSLIWFPASSAFSFEVAFTLRYQEKRPEKEIEIKEISYSRQVLEGDLEWMQDRFKYQLYSDPFFAYLGQNIAATESLEYRKPLELTVNISAADEDLSLFISRNNPDTDTRRDFKGNLEGALGIVAAKCSRKFEKKQLSPKAMDSLRNGRFTRKLKFVNNPDW